MRSPGTPAAPDRSRRRPALWFGALALLAVVGGCSSATSSPTPGTQTVVPPVATTSPVVTDAPTTTQAATAATPLVRQAVLDYWAASRACGQRPAQCRPDTFTAATGTLRADVHSYVAMLISSNYHLGDDDPSGYVVVNSVTIDLATSTTATTDECVYDPTPLLGAPAADGTPTIISTAAVPHRFVHTFSLEDGTWLPSDEQVDPSAACDQPPDTVPVEFTTPGS